MKYTCITLYSNNKYNAIYHYKIKNSIFRPNKKTPSTHNNIKLANSLATQTNLISILNIGVLVHGQYSLL